MAKGASEDLINFEIATSENYEPNWHHEVIAAELEHIIEHGDRDYKILMVFVPPRHGKSQQCTIDLPAYYLGKKPDAEVIVASYSADLSQDFSTKARDKFNSDEYKAIFPGYRVNPMVDTKAKWGIQRFDKEKNKFVTKKGSYTAVGVGGPVTGRGADLFVIDDPIKNRKEAESEVYRKAIWDWWRSTAWTRLEPHGVFLIILTRWHMADLAGMILADEEMSEMVKTIQFPAVATHDEAYRHKGHALWPEKYPLEVLKRTRRTLGPYEWSSLYQQSPILTENQEFNPAWYKRISQHEVDRISSRRVLIIDTAMSKKTEADYTGFCDARIDKEGFWYVSGWRHKLGPEELVDELFTLQRNHKYELIGIEETTYTIGLKPYLDSEMRKRGRHLPIVPLKHKQTSKEVRIRGLQPFYSAGTIFHIDGQTSTLEEEQAHFPLGLHDDTLDAEAYIPQIIGEHMKDEGQSVKIHRPKAPQ